MLEYIKMMIISFISGVFSPLAVSSTAHYSFLASALNLSDNNAFLGFYSSAVTVTFSAVVFVYLRKIYSKGLRAAFSKKRGAEKSIARNLLISLIPAVIMFIPVSKTTFIGDIFATYLGKKPILVTAFCCLASGLFLLLALWYSRQKRGALRRSLSLSGILRFALYQLPPYIFPGLSHISMGAAAVIVDNVDERAAAREALLYFAPSAFAVGLFRMIRYASSGLSVDPVMLVICAVFTALSSALIMNAVGKVNMKKLFSFFSVYSIVFGLFTAVASFFI